MASTILQCDEDIACEISQIIDQHLAVLQVEEEIFKTNPYDCLINQMKKKINS